MSVTLSPLSRIVNVRWPGDPQQPCLFFAKVTDLHGFNTDPLKASTDRNPVAFPADADFAPDQTTWQVGPNNSETVWVYNHIPSGPPPVFPPYVRRAGPSQSVLLGYTADKLKNAGFSQRIVGDQIPVQLVLTFFGREEESTASYRVEWDFYWGESLQFGLVTQDTAGFYQYTGPYDRLEQGVLSFAPGFGDQAYDATEIPGVGFSWASKLRWQLDKTTGALGGPLFAY